ncbi:hypothetical protein, conserved [Leishmania tarentolae]|uniref:Uncharacterized protein n=1 Tax=Leishmania tarentolae TaxID=5689 RepID=A0A640KRF0_LEITA|nr:hypothetical protein, conserved [Leishmania tarentolae]
MPTPQAGSRSPSPVSPRSSSTMVPKTSDRRKVLRKKLVVVVRRKRGDSAPSANDPVVQMSLLPLKEGTAAVLKANSSLQGSPQQRRTRSSSASSTAATPTLEKLINKVEQGRSASVASRCPSRASERHGHAGENEISEEDRRRFRHALSALSSRSVSRRASPSPSATTKAERSQRSRTCSPGSRSNASNDCARLRRRSGSADEESVLHTSDAAVRSSGHGRRSDGGHRHKSRRRHSHESIAHSAAKHRRRSLSATSMPGAPYCATQNDEFYGTADMAKDVASLIPSPLQERIGITPMSMPLLPRLVLRSEMGVLPPGKYTNHPHCNIDTAQHANGSWSASDDEEGYDVGRITDGASGGYGSRPLTLQLSSATQTDGVTGVNLALGSARSGMPLLAVTPVQRTAAIGSIGSTHGRGQPSKLIRTSVPTLGEGVVASSLALVHNTAGKAVGHETTVLTVEGGAENSLLDEEAFVTESPASFVKRTASPAATKAFTGSTSRILSGRSIGASIGRSETNVFGGNVGASRTAADAPWPTHTPPFGGASVHRAASGSQWVTHSPGIVEPAMMDAVVSVPLFVPPLTVDNVSHLSHDWQSTLRERSSKAKRSAMEDFLIASAEAGAAATAAAVAAAAAASSPPPYLADSATPDADPYKMFTSGRGRLTVPTVGNEDPSERQRRARPAQSHQPLALEEFYGCTVPPADTATVPLSVHALPPQSRSRSCSEIKRDVRQRSGSPGSAAQREPERQQAKSPSPSSTRSETNSVRGAAAMSADGISKGGATFIKSRDGVEERSTSARKHSRSQGCRASTERGTHSNGDPLTDAVEVEFPSALAADSPRKSSSSSRSRSAIGNGTAAIAATATATNEAGVRSTLPPPRFFSIVETGTESRSMENAAGKRHGNQRDKRRKHLSRRSPSEASQSPSSKRRKTSNKHKKHKKRKHGHGRHDRYSRSCTHSLSSRTGDAAVVEIDSGSDVDSNLTTSMEFQLSRLLLLREAAVFTELPPSSTVDASRRSARKKGKAERKATKEAAAAKDENHRHRSRSSRDEKRKRSPQRSTRRHRDRSDTKKKKKGHRRSISPPKPGPLPPPPPHRHSRALYGEETAVGGVSDSIFEAAAPRSNATSRYRRGDGDAFASTRSYFRDGKIFSDGQVEGAEAACARYRPTAHAGEDSETLYERYRWRSHTSALRGQRSYAASEATGEADTSRPVDRPAPHPTTAVEGPALWHRSYSSANRPSTRWNDYVQDSESGAASRASLHPYTHAHHSRFLAQKRHSSSTGITKAGECSSRGGAEGDSHSSAQPVPRTYSSTYTNRRRQTCELEDLDDVPIRQYFNAPTARPSLFNNYEQGSAAARKKHVNENDLLVSTPPNDGNGESVPDNARDLSRPCQFQTRGSRAPPLPPPPSPPQASTAPSSAPADTLFAAIPSAGALPIVTEHTVTDAQMAEVFVQGVRDIISSLHQYRNSM